MAKKSKLSVVIRVDEDTAMTTQHVTLPSSPAVADSMLNTPVSNSKYSPKKCNIHFILGVGAVAVSPLDLWR